MSHYLPVELLAVERLAARAASEIAVLCRESDLLDPETVRHLIARRGRPLWVLFEMALWWTQVVR